MVEPSVEERAVGRKAAESRATVPTVELSVDLTTRPGPTSGLLLKACAEALREHPRANAAYRDGRFELYSRINIGVVVAEGDHYLIPTVFDADLKSPDYLDDEAEQLADEALTGRLPASGFAGATFTLWHAARHGLAGAALPVVAPQAASLAAGTRTVTLSCDHRILYGASAAAFLAAVKSRLVGEA